MALKLAKLAVTYAPSEYLTWAKLTEIYIHLGEYENVITIRSLFVFSTELLIKCSLSISNSPLFSHYLFLSSLFQGTSFLKFLSHVYIL